MHKLCNYRRELEERQREQDELEQMHQQLQARRAERENEQTRDSIGGVNTLIYIQFHMIC